MVYDPPRGKSDARAAATASCSWHGWNVATATIPTADDAHGARHNDHTTRWVPPATLRRSKRDNGTVAVSPSADSIAAVTPTIRVPLAHGTPSGTSTTPMFGHICRPEPPDAVMRTIGLPGVVAETVAE